MHRLRVVSSVALAAVLIATSALGASAIADQPIQDRGFVRVERTAPQALTGGEGLSAAALCNFEQLGDYAHVSSSAPPTASAHGWWRNVDCNATHAVVTTQLQKKNVAGFWVDVGTRGVKTVLSGGGSVARSNSRYVCSGTSKHQFRSWVDVDLVGINDLPNKLYTSERTLDCN